MLGREEGWTCEVLVDTTRLEHGQSLNIWSRKVASGRKFAGAIRSVVNARSLQPVCIGLLHETYSCLFYCVVMKRWRGGRRRGLKLGCVDVRYLGHEFDRFNVGQDGGETKKLVG